MAKELCQCPLCHGLRSAGVEMTENEIKEFYSRLEGNITKELGLEDELRFTRYEENKEAAG